MVVALGSVAFLPEAVIAMFCNLPLVADMVISTALLVTSAPPGPVLVNRRQFVGSLAGSVVRLPVVLQR